MPSYVDQGRPFSLPLASLAGTGGTPANAKIWATFLPIEAPTQSGRAPRGISCECPPPPRALCALRPLQAPPPAPPRRLALEPASPRPLLFPSLGNALNLAQPTRTQPTHPLSSPSLTRPATRILLVIVRDLDLVTIYDSTGQFAGVRRAGSGKPIVVDGVTIIVDNIVGSTGERADSTRERARLMHAAV